MTLEEFKKNAEDEEWAPGWDAIEAEFARLYPEQKPAHYGTTINSRAIFGGDEYLDGFSIYSSPKGYKHIVTFGMTELYADEEMLGGEWNKWGYEMTIKLAESDPENCVWALNMLSNLARYTYKSGIFFEPLEFVKGDGTSLHIGVESDITALFVINDTEAQTLNTIYGETQFLQFVGITQHELEALIENPESADKLYELMKQDNPDFVTDMTRTKSYL